LHGRYDAAMPRSKPEPNAAELVEQLPVSPALRALAQRGELRRYAKGTLLIQEGDIGDTLYLIVKGRLRAFSVNVNNGREITYGHYGPGEYVGEMGLDGGPRAATVMALEATVCAVITRRTLEQFITEHPAFAFELLAKVIRRARAATLTARQLALNDVYGRLKLLLDSLAVEQADGTRLIAEKLTHQDIANRIGCTREMVSRVMKELVEGGQVVAEEGALRLLRSLPARW
jgi:CRP/FNR family transcriptional regulator, cyclic AMP receptor protein